MSTIVMMKIDVDKLKSTDISMIFQIVEILDMTIDTTGGEVRIEKTVDPESKVETVKDMFWMVNEVMSN